MTHFCAVRKEVYQEHVAQFDNAKCHFLHCEGNTHQVVRSAANIVPTSFGPWCFSENYHPLTHGAFNGASISCSLPN